MDLADQIDDYICSFEGIGDIAMDSLVMFVFIWAVLALFIVWLCKFLYNKYVVNKDQTATINNNSSSNNVIINGASKLLNGGDKTAPVRLSSEPRDILSSKETKEIATKSLGAGIPIGGVRGRSGSGHMGSGGVGGGGQLRKRLVRQTSTGPETRKKRNIPPPSNVVGPETSSVTWTSQVFRWLYSDLVIVNELLNSWVQAMNDTLKKSFVEHGVGVEIVRVLPDSPAPLLSNLFCNSDESNPADMIITCDCDAMPVLQVKTYRQKSGKVDTSHYKVTVSRLRARLAAPMNYNTLKGEMKIEGYPDIRIAMNSVGPIKPIDQDEQQLQEVIGEILTTTLRDTVYPIDFSIYLTCPRAEIEIPEIPHNMENLNSALQNQYFSQNGQTMASGKRLLVKIVKGDGLMNARDIYCVVEMDEPPQKNQTGIRQGPNPFWDEHFLFDLSQHSAEILFEVYDRSVIINDSPKFLGLGLVGIDELTIGPTSSQVLKLQPRPYEQQTVNGNITIEFVVIEGADVPVSPRQNKLTEAIKISSPMINEHLRNGSDLADAAVRAIQDGALAPNGKPSKSTLIIHSVQRNESNIQSPSFKMELNKEGSIEIKEIETSEENIENPETFSNNDDNNIIINDISTTANSNASPSQSINRDNEDCNLNETSKSQLEKPGNESSGNLDEFGRPLAASSPNNHLKQINGNGNNSMSYNPNSLSRSELTPNDMSADDRGRSKKRNFFGTLKKRLGRSKPRATSADRGMIPINLDNFNGESSRSISVDRGFLKKNHSIGQKIVVPTLDQSRRSSISESSAFSGFSSASNKTYVHESSTLVLETIENGIKKHYLVPLAVAQKPKWRRKGTKLHIYNEHTFVAKHLSGSGLQCAICVNSIPRRPGKQGYECRDCRMICHKQCHVRAPQVCPNATIMSLELSTLPNETKFGRR